MRSRTIGWVAICGLLWSGCLFAPRWDVAETSISENEAGTEEDAPSSEAEVDSAADVSAGDASASDTSASDASVDVGSVDSSMLRDVLRETAADVPAVPEVGPEPTMEASVPDVQNADSALDATDAAAMNGESGTDGA